MILRLIVVEVVFKVAVEVVVKIIVVNVKAWRLGITFSLTC